MRRLWAAVLWLGCNRAPSELPPASTSTSTSTTSTTSATSATAMATSTASATTTATSTSSVSVPTGSGTAPAKCVAPLATAASPTPRPAGDRCPADVLRKPPKLPHAPIAFTAAGVTVDAELASTPDQTERGLMYRKNMPEEQGMFFFLESRREQTFWMHNTCIPLDMLFIDDDGTIVGVVENAPVLDDDPRSVGCPSHFVLEVNAGWVRRHGVKPGQKVALPTL